MKGDLNAELLLAADRGDYEACKQLLDAGADRHAADGDGWTALHKAANTECSATCRVLIEAGANANALDNHWGAPLHYATSISTFSALVDCGADPFLMPKGAEPKYLTPFQFIVSYSTGNEFKDGLRIVRDCIERFGEQILDQCTVDGRPLTALARSDNELREFLLSKATERAVVNAIDDAVPEPVFVPSERGFSPM